MKNKFYKLFLLQFFLAFLLKIDIIYLYMDKYEIIIYWSDEDKVFIAEVPELPDCTVHGNTHETALINVKDAITLWD